MHKRHKRERRHDAAAAKHYARLGGTDSARPAVPDLADVKRGQLFDLAQAAGHRPKATAKNAELREMIRNPAR